jgi:hypothetical protein
MYYAVDGAGGLSSHVEERSAGPSLGREESPATSRRAESESIPPQTEPPVDPENAFVGRILSRSTSLTFTPSLSRP